MYKEEAFEAEDKCWRENELGHRDMEKRMCMYYPPLTPPPQTSCTGGLELEGRSITHTLGTRLYLTCHTPAHISNSRHPSDHRSEANVNCPPENISGAT